MTDLLMAALRQLAAALQPDGIVLTVVGGYGLVLRTEAVRLTGERTLGGPVRWSRSTDDIDCFLGHSVITDATKTERIRLALEQLGYRAATEHFLYERTVQTGTRAVVVRIDLMAAPVPAEDADRVVASDLRIHPVGYDRLHGRVTPGAALVDESPMSLDISSSGTALIVNLPHAYPYLILKLFALRDGPASRRPERAARHALDMFTIWATITEAEYLSGLALREKFAAHPIVSEAREIASTLFAGLDAPAILSLRVEARDSDILLETATIDAFQRDILMMLGAKAST